MTLSLYTSRVWYVGEDRFDITRGSGGIPADPFAPSESILQAVKRAKRAAVRQHNIEAANAAWADYEIAYAAEMQLSQQKHVDAWRKLLARDRVVLICYCPTANRCHRGLLADILVKLGARYLGEIETE